jgi:DNA-binding FrmR family transcriptional regulator
MDLLYPLSLAVRVDGALVMDKKVKKKTHVLQQRIQTLRQQLAGARKQMDDPAELRSIEQQLAAAEAELAKVKN